MTSERINALLHFWQMLTPESVAVLGDHYAEDAFFKDPFHEVRGLGPIREIFANMFRQVESPKFKVSETIGDENGLVLVWEMTFRMRSLRPHEVQVIRGVSHLRFGENGKVNYHRDYWDTGEELYSKLPLIGSVVRLLRCMGG